MRKRRNGVSRYQVAICWTLILTGGAYAQQASSLPTHNVNETTDNNNHQEQQYLNRIRELEQRLAAVEARLDQSDTSRLTSGAAAAPLSVVQQSATRVEERQPQITEPSGMSLPGGLEINAYFDGYYSWNANRQYNRINLLRAYDVLHNNFSINQTGLVIQQSVDPDNGKRLGLRVDLMYGQATETVQGGTQNELRPQVYRSIFQAYGTYVAPVGSGLTVDFGKFAGSLGYEGNYTKDQFNYSRAYFFNFLPFYHMGFRSSYAFNDRVSLTHWLVNGAQQTEDFNHFKSNAFLLNFKPTPKVSWNINYYFGQENREYIAVYNPELPSLPTQPGLPVEAIQPAPDGRFHVIDSYASWNATDKLTLVGEADYVVNRAEGNSPPSRVIGGAAYANYWFVPQLALATRFEYFNDRHGLFSGISQTLKENTITMTVQPRPGFQLRAEWRRDSSDKPFFLTGTPGLLKREQNTALLGLLWWFGTKQGSW